MLFQKEIASQAGGIKAHRAVPRLSCLCVVCNLCFLQSAYLKLCDTLQGLGCFRSPLAHYFCRLPFGSLGVSLPVAALRLSWVQLQKSPLPVNINPLVSYAISDAFCGNSVPDQLGNIFSIDSVFGAISWSSLPARKGAQLEPPEPPWVGFASDPPRQNPVWHLLSRTNRLSFGHQIFLKKKNTTILNGYFTFTVITTYGLYASCCITHR